MPKDKTYDPKDINPKTVAGARRLLSDPDALDKAIESGLGSQRPDPTYDATKEKK